MRSDEEVVFSELVITGVEKHEGEMRIKITLDVDTNGICTPIVTFVDGDKEMRLDGLE